MDGAAREKDQADFDLERFIDMFDEALNSKDPRVINALRSLMMIVTLTQPESRNPLADRNSGPLRRLYEDMNHLSRRLYDVEDSIRSNRTAIQEEESPWGRHERYKLKAEAAAIVNSKLLGQANLVKQKNKDK